MDKKIQDDFVKKTVDKTNYILEDTLLDSEVTIEDIKNYKYEDIVKNNTKDRMSKIPWLISIFLILAISLILGSKFLNGNPVAIFTNTIDRFFIAITDNISDNNYEISKGKMNLKLEINSKENKEFFDELSKTSFDIDYTLDNANDLLKLDLLSKYEEEDLINLNIYNDKDNIYIYSDDIYEKYLKIKNTSKIKFINLKDIKVLLNGLNQAFDKVATSSEITGGNTNFDLGEKSIRVYESKLTVDKNNYKMVSETFINTLKSNTEFVSSLAKTKGVSNKSVQKSLDDLLPKLRQFFVDNESLEIKLYNDKKTKEFLKGNISGKLGSFTLSKNGDTMNFVLVNDRDNEKMTGEITTKINDKKTNYDLNYSFEYYVNSDLENSLKIKLTFTNNKASSFKRVNVSEAVDVSDLTDLEKFGIYGKMFSNPNLSKFLKFIK